MHHFFKPLSDREAMLLLTTLTVGGSDQTGIFDYLGPEAAGRLHEKAQALVNIPSDKRIPFMVKQMKGALRLKGLRGVERVDPSWLLQGMRGESPRVVGAILVSLPPPVVRSLLKRLPSGIRKNLPPKSELDKVPEEIVRSIRLMFESRFHAMPVASGRSLAFVDVIHLERKELYKVLRDLGLVELGQAFVAVGKLALAELCRRLPRSKAEELILAVRRASRLDIPDLKTAQRFLSRVVVNFDDTEEFFQKAGLWRLAKASGSEDESFQASFIQRMPRDAGLLFKDYMDKAAAIEDLSPEVLGRLQDSVVLRIKRLSEMGILGPRWAQFDPVFNDPNYEAIAAEAEAVSAPTSEAVPQAEPEEL